jgi:hypothetical protein
VTHRRRAALFRTFTLGAILTAGGCGSTATPTTGPSASFGVAQPSGQPVLGIDWGRAASVERPKNFEVDPNSPEYTGTHPILRFPGQAMLADIVGLPRGGFVTVGYLPPDWVPAAWTSIDGTTWSIHLMGTTDFTFPVSLAAGDDGTVVAVGRSEQLPVAWTTVDGIEWSRHPVPVLGGDIAERMTAVAAGEHGYVAGGSVGPEIFERHARFWTSADGSEWHPVPDDPDAFANAEVRAITRFGDGFVAVGVVGSVQHPSGAVAWTSADGVAWTRVDDPSFVAGLAVSVAISPSGGLVAVGSDLVRHEALVWTSPDSRRWTKAPSEPSRQHPAYIWMTDITAVGDSLVAVGDFQSGQRGTATSWVSRDGIHWDRARTAPVQEQVELYAITPGGPGAIAVGSFGAPDSYVPTIFLSPAR